MVRTEVSSAAWQAREESRGIPHLLSSLGFRRRPRPLHTKTAGQVVTSTTLKPEKLGGVEGAQQESAPLHSEKKWWRLRFPGAEEPSDYTELRNYTSQKALENTSSSPHFRRFGAGRGWWWVGRRNTFQDPQVEEGPCPPLLELQPDSLEFSAKDFRKPSCHPVTAKFKSSSLTPAVLCFISLIKHN